jgi:parvulin-like peptidyl-prolyl isomerase
MLQQLRNPKWMKWGMWAILGLTIPSFVAFYGFSDIQGSGPRPAGEVLGSVQVDGEKVELKVDSMRAARETAAGYYSQIAAAVMPDPQQLRGLQQEIFSALDQNPRLYSQFAVSNVAMQQRVDERNLRITDNQVAEYLRAAGVNQENFKQLYGNRSEYEVKAMIRRQLETDMAERTVSGIARTSLLELWKEFLLQEEKLTASVARIPVTIDPTAAVSDEEVKAKYEDLVAAESPIVREEEKRRYEFVALRLPPRTPPAAPTDAELQALYDAAPETDTELNSHGGIQVRQLVFAGENALARATEASARIKAGEPIASVADAISDDLRNLKFSDAESSPTLRGGLIPYLLQGDQEAAWGAEYARFVESADQGAISDVISTPQGLVIVQLDERRSAGRRPFEEVRDTLAARAREAAQEKQASEREALTTQNIGKIRAARRNVTNLAGVARELSLSVETTSPTLSTQFFIPGIGNLNRESEALTNLRTGSMSEVLQTPSGDAVVVRIAELIPPATLPMDAIRPRLEQQIRADKAATKANEAADVIIERLKTNPDDQLTSAAIELGYQGEVIESFSRQSVPDVLRTAENVSLKLAAARKGDVLTMLGGTVDMPVEIFIVRIEDVQEPTKEEFLQNVLRLETQLLSAKRQGYLEEFRRDMMAKLEPEFDPAFVGEPAPRSRR